MDEIRKFRQSRRKLLKELLDKYSIKELDDLLISIAYEMREKREYWEFKGRYENDNSKK
tara:strand:+ start:994 stop:1170 length:177 start_codon:yes stop_codon:yes gene_type:complete